MIRLEKIKTLLFVLIFDKTVQRKQFLFTLKKPKMVNFVK